MGSILVGNLFIQGIPSISLYKDVVVPLPIPVGKLKEDGGCSGQDLLDGLQVGVIPALQVGNEVLDGPKTQE